MKGGSISFAASAASQNFKLNRPNIYNPPLSILRRKLALMVPHNNRRASNLSTPVQCTRKFANQGRELAPNAAWRSNR